MGAIEEIRDAVREITKCAANNDVYRATSQFMPDRVRAPLTPPPRPRPAMVPSPSIPRVVLDVPKPQVGTEPRHYLQANTRPDPPKAVLRENSNDVAMRASTAGLYSMLGRPDLDRQIDAGIEAARETGGPIGRALAPLAKLPDRVVTAAGISPIGAPIGAVAEPVYTTLKPVYTALKALRVPIAAGTGAKKGWDAYADTGSVRDAVASGLQWASLPYGILGGAPGKLALMYGTGSGMEEASRTGSVAEGLKEGVKDGMLTWGGMKLMHWVPNKLARMGAPNWAVGTASALTPTAVVAGPAAVDSWKSGVERDKAERELDDMVKSDFSSYTDSNSPAFMNESIGRGLDEAKAMGLLDKRQIAMIDAIRKRKADEARRLNDVADRVTYRVPWSDSAKAEMLSEFAGKPWTRNVVSPEKLVPMKRVLSAWSQGREY